MPSDANGIILQQVTFSTSDPLLSPVVPTYWEAWTVTNGSVSPAIGDANDEFIAPSANYSITGLVQYYPGATMAAFPELMPGGTFMSAPPSGILPSTYNTPANWTTNGALPHQIVVVPAPTLSGYAIVSAPP